MKLDLDADNVQLKQVTAQELRDLLDSKNVPLGEELEYEFDTAQGDIFTGAYSHKYIVIKVVP